jgi:hypothetical protein
VEMDIRERLIICTDSGLQQARPKASALGPARLDAWRLPDGDALKIRRTHLKDRRQDRRGNSEDQIERARHGPPDRPGVDQDLAKERSRTLDFGRVLIFAWQRVAVPLTRAFPPIGTLKVEIQEQHRAAPRSLTYAPSRTHQSSHRRARSGL